MSDKREQILNAGLKGVDELIKVLESPILLAGDELSADKMKVAAAAKRLAFEDALAIYDRVQAEKNADEYNEIEVKAAAIPVSFVESKAKTK